jgi:hypothetical protein
LSIRPPALARPLALALARACARRPISER